MNPEFKQLEREINQHLGELSDRLAVTPPSGLQQRLRQRVQAALHTHSDSRQPRRAWPLWSAIAAAAAIALMIGLPQPGMSSTPAVEVAKEWSVWAAAIEDSQGTIATALMDASGVDSWTVDDQEIDAYLESYDLLLGTGT
jgi:hypothetical protein